jgi:hypothetical protein
MSRPLPSLDRLRELLDYNPDTGEIVYKVNRRAGKAGDRAGCINGLGYVQIMVDRACLLGHRVAFALYHGYWPDRVDHIDGVTSNNRISNLRECSASENQWNRKAQAGRSLPKGVTFAKGGYQAAICANSKHHYLGRFPTAKTAHAAYAAAALEHHGAFARLE